MTMAQALRSEQLLTPRMYRSMEPFMYCAVGFAVLDGWTVGLSPKNAKVKTEYIVDGVHPNPIGHELIGASLARMLNAI